MEFKSIFDQNDKWKNVLYIIVGLFFLPVIVKFTYLFIICNKWSFIPLLLGIMYEGRKLYGSWRPLFENLVISLGVGFYSFILDKEKTDISKSVAGVIFMFISAFLVSFLVKFHNHRQNITRKLSEGVTLLHSVAIIYWCIDFTREYGANNMLRSLFILLFCISLFSIVHAFTKIPLTDSNRFDLSLWSSLVMIWFSVDYIISVYRNNPETEVDSLLSGSYFFLVYFLLGVAVIYIAQNVNMIIGFLPQKGETRSKNRRRREVLKKDHINRYSDEQVSVWYSLFCMIFSCSLFWLNLNYQFVNRQFMIWIVFVTFPLIIHFFELFKSKRNLKKA